MTMHWWILGTCVCCAAGCADSSSRTARAPQAPRAAAPPVSAKAEAPARESPRRAVAADPALAERFAVSRQVTALERSIELYEAFIVRAGDDPRYAEAVRRSRGRIE